MPLEPRQRRSFELKFSFTDFTPDGTLDQEVLAERIFDHLIEGNLDAEGAWSIDGWDVVR